ncbi:MAG: ferritin-like domain-containing protein [Methylobacter sp.]|uniref:ferritin-like domain-containing protein n=1 Tax=Methylobacter sp. TaxID=2051955 RepID=UPI00258EEE78|nr:ferritin-like domain-containing protein [Methylobacter sp.]MCL7422554.1 ferritin-like domain-containing protein [Methylobacter sp.]
MNQPVEMSMRNRTGIDRSPADSQKMIDAANAYMPSSKGNGSALMDMESGYIQEAEPVGTVAIPGTLKGAAKATMQMLAGRNAEVLVDKLGERLAFERTGTRLYDYFINKCETMHCEAPISIDTLKRFRQEESQHFKLVANALETLGADSTSQTPGADVSAVASSGVLQVMSDPRTSVDQSLEAMLNAELVDNAGWDLLVKLADEMGLEDMAKDFQVALSEEDEHLMEIRQWYEQCTLKQAGAI